MKPAMLTIALAQMDVLTGQPDANLARARDFAAQARDAGADLREIHKARRYLTVYEDRRPMLTASSHRPTTSIQQPVL